MNSKDGKIDSKVMMIGKVQENSKSSKQVKRLMCETLNMCGAQASLR